MSEMSTVKTTVTVQALRGMSMPGRTCKSQSEKSSQQIVPRDLLYRGMRKMADHRLSRTRKVVLTLS
jgi:hypothetical protein